MKIIKQINNNAALALDGNGNEIVVLGRGVGFPKMPYELTDLSRIEKTFYDVDPRYLGMAAALPQPVLLVSADIAERAEIELDCELNPNLPFTLADHLNFAIERFRKGIDVPTPLAYDVKHLYPRETELGYCALDMVEEQAGIRLPDTEAVNVALHLINAEAESGDMHSMMMTLKIIGEVDAIVERKLHIRLDKDSFHYSRFTMHLRYLIQRQAGGDAQRRHAAPAGAGVPRCVPVRPRGGGVFQGHLGLAVQQRGAAVPDAAHQPCAGKKRGLNAARSF